MKKDLSPTHASEAPLTAKDKATKEHENHEMRRLGTTKDAYTEAPHAEEPGGQKVAETIVEHPLAPTDDRPNPQGDRDEPFVAVVTKEAPEYHMTKPDDGEGKGVEIENTTDRELHLGDGRVVHPGGRAKVSHDLAKSEGLKGKIKHV
jgi:hypothetical protein